MEGIAVTRHLLLINLIVGFQTAFPYLLAQDLQYAHHPRSRLNPGLLHHLIMILQVHSLRRDSMTVNRPPALAERMCAENASMQ